MANNAHSQMALDLMLKTFTVSSEFTGMPEKNWTAISRLVPGTTPRQCQKRYEELLKEGLTTTSYGTYAFTMTRANNVPATKPVKGDSEPGEKGSRPGSAKVKGSKPEKESTSGKGNQRPDSGDQGPVMVIHVCDEAKNLKQDFHCPRDLLIREMKYFAEYLSTDAQRWEEVDISVHCDVQIFDWLMRHVKRGTREVTNPPKLEPTNVISILISSDFLKMDNLVTECVEFCHKNMSAIVATPCNMNCINDRLVGRITELFDHNEANDIKDRKDKFKSKLFAKIVEKLFDPTTKNISTPENSSTLFRCSICKKIITNTLETKLKCFPNRMMVDRSGHLCYHHVHDQTWDVNDYLIELKGQLKTWRDVYWRLWGTINCAKCARCGEYFACADLGHCRFHPEPPVYDTDSGLTAKAAIGKFECCGVTVLRFDPTQPNKGCKLRDHVISLAKPDSSEALADPHYGDKQRIHNDLLAHRDIVCTTQPPTSSAVEEPEPNVFADEEQLMGVKPKEGVKSMLEAAGLDDVSKPEELMIFHHAKPHKGSPMKSGDFCAVRGKGVGEYSYDPRPLHRRNPEGYADSVRNACINFQCSSQMPMLQMIPPANPYAVALDHDYLELTAEDLFLKKNMPPSKPRLQALTIERQVSNDDEFAFGESDDEVGDDEESGKIRKSRISRRVTVDPQAILLDAPDFSTTKMRKWDSSRSMRWNQDAQREEDQRRMNDIVKYLIRLRISPEKIDKLKQKEYAGGLFAKLEAQWKAANIQPPKAANPQFRNKPRLSQLVTK